MIQYIFQRKRILKLLGYFFPKDIEGRERKLESGMYSDGQQALLGSRDVSWLGRGTVGSVGPGETALVSLIS